MSKIECVDRPCPDCGAQITLMRWPQDYSCDGLYEYAECAACGLTVRLGEPEVGGNPDRLIRRKEDQAMDDINNPERMAT